MSVNVHKFPPKLELEVNVHKLVYTSKNKVDMTDGLLCTTNLKSIYQHLGSPAVRAANPLPP